MRRLALVSVLATLTVPKPMPAIEISMDGQPTIAEQNLVRNGDMESADANGHPAYWSFGTAMADNFETGWVDGGRSGKCLWLRARTGKMSGYWNQNVPVEPGKTYLWHGYYRLGGGRILCYAHARKELGQNRWAEIDERFYAGSLRGHWLSPVFLPAEALAGPDPREWIPFRLRVRVPEGLPAISLSMGMYFTPGEVAFDDVWFGRERTDLSLIVRASPQERIARISVHQEMKAEPIFDSGELRAMVANYQTTLKDQMVDATYTVTVTLDDGRTVTRAFHPLEGEKP